MVRVRLSGVALIAPKKRSKAEYDKEYKQRPEVKKRDWERYLLRRETEEFKLNHNKRNLVYKRKNKVKIKSYYENKTRWKLVEQKYGITRDQWFKMYELQEGKCAVCRRELKLGGRRTGTSVMTEHNHSNLNVRGLSCNYCNTHIIPFFEKELERIDHLKEYLVNEKDYRKIME